MKKSLPIIIFDLVTFIFVTFAITSIFTDFRFMGNYPRLASIPFLMTFTGLSNLFIGIVSLMCALYRIITKKETLPKWLFMIKVVFLTQISITFLITAIYLAPNLGADWWRLYFNASLFNHLLTPVTAIVGFIIFEKRVATKWQYCFYTTAPILAYAVMYISNVYTHLNPDGTTSLNYDIYGFFRYGWVVFFLFLAAFLGLAFGITNLYRFIKREKQK